MAAAREWVDAYVTQGHVDEDQPFTPLHPDPVLDYQMKWDVDTENRTYSGLDVSPLKDVRAPDFTGIDFLPAPNGDAKITRYDSVDTTNALTRVMVPQTLAVDRTMFTEFDYEPCGVDMMHIWYGATNSSLFDGNNPYNSENKYRMLYNWSSSLMEYWLIPHWGEDHENDSDKGRWDERYKEGGNNHSSLFQRIVNSSIVHLDYLLNDAYGDLGFEAHKYYFVKEGLDQSGWWGFSLGATEDITLPNGTVIAAGTIMRIPESTGGGAFARLTHVYGCYWAGTAGGGIKWGQKNPNEKGLSKNNVYVGHEPINMRVYDGRDAPESKLFIRPIFDEWRDSSGNLDDDMNWANGYSKVKELWLNSGFSQLSDFDFVVKGTYGDGTSNTSAYGNHERYGPRVVTQSGDRRLLQESDTFTVTEHMYDDNLTYDNKPWAGFPQYLGFGHIRLTHAVYSTVLDSTCWINEPIWQNGWTEATNAEGGTYWRRTPQYDVQKATFEVRPTRAPAWFDASGWADTTDLFTNKPFLITLANGEDVQVRRDDPRGDGMFRLQRWPVDGEATYVTYSDIGLSAQTVNVKVPSKTRWVTSNVVPAWSYWPWIDNETVQTGSSSTMVAKGLAGDMQGVVQAGGELTLHKWEGDSPWTLPPDTNAIDTLYTSDTSAQEPCVLAGLSMYTATLEWKQPDDWSPGKPVGSTWAFPFEDQVLSSAWAGSSVTYRAVASGSRFTLDDNSGINFTLKPYGSRSTQFLLEPSNAASSLPQYTDFWVDGQLYYIWYNHWGDNAGGHIILAKLRGGGDPYLQWTDGTVKACKKTTLPLDVRDKHCLNTNVVKSVSVNLRRFNFDYRDNATHPGEVSLGYSCTYYDFAAPGVWRVYNFEPNGPETVKYCVDQGGTPTANQHRIEYMTLTGAAGDEDSLRLVSLPQSASHTTETPVSLKTIAVVAEDQRCWCASDAPPKDWRMVCTLGDHASTAPWGWHSHSVFHAGQMYSIKEDAWGPERYGYMYDGAVPFYSWNFCTGDSTAEFTAWTREGNGLKISETQHKLLIDREHLTAAAKAGGWYDRPFGEGTVFTYKAGAQALDPFEDGKDYTVSRSSISGSSFVYEFTDIDLAGVVVYNAANPSVSWDESVELTFDVHPNNYNEPGGPRPFVMPKRGFDLPSVALTPHVHLVHELQLVEYAVTGGYDLIAIWVDGLNGRKSFFHSSEGLEGAFTVLMNMSGSTTREVDYRILRPPDSYVTTAHYQGDGDHLDPMVPLAPPLLVYDPTVNGMGEEAGWTMRPQKATIPTVHMVAPDNGHFGRMVVDSAQACVDPCQFAGTQLGVTLRELKVTAKQRYWNYTSGQFEWRAVWPIHLRFRLLVSPHRRDGRTRSVGN